MEQPWGDFPEKNYDAGRPAASYKPSEFKFGHALHVPGIRGLTAMAVVRYALRAEGHFLNAQRHHQNTSPWHIRAGEQLSSMRDELELMIYCMRKSLDHLIQGIFVNIYSDEIQRSGNISIDSIGGALKAKEKNRNPDFTRMLFGDRDGKIEHFLKTLNTLSNAYKHGYLLTESVMVYSPDGPNIVVPDVPNKRIKDRPTVHNYSAVHLMMGYQDVFDRLLIDLGACSLFDHSNRAY